MDDEWVTLAEAELEVGVSRSALRSWYRAGDIQSRLLDGPNGPQRLVLLGEVELRAARSPKLLRRAEREQILAEEVVRLGTAVDALEARVALLERLVGDSGP